MMTETWLNESNRQNNCCPKAGFSHLQPVNSSYVEESYSVSEDGVIYSVQDSSFYLFDSHEPMWSKGMSQWDKIYHILGYPIS